MPFCDLRSRIGPIRPLAAALILAVATPGCAGSEPHGVPEDARTPPAADAGARGVEHDGSAADGAFPGPDPSSREDEFGAAACFNAVDDDGDGRSDCADTTCAATPFCCLGQSTQACCGAPVERLRVDFATCPGTDPSSCTTQGTSFGQPAPVLEDRAFVPNGSLSDAGMVLGDALDATRERIRISAVLAASIDSCTDCLDAVALGIGDAVAGDLVIVRPDVAVLVRAARADVALVIAGEVVQTAPLADADEHLYTLVLDPGGDVELLRDGIAFMADRWAPRPDRRVLLYGRTHNRPAGAPRPARATELVVAAVACEIPSAIERAGTPVFPDPSWGSLEARAPSVELDGESALVAFEVGPHVHLARIAADGSWALAGSGDINLPVLIAPVGEALRDPELVRTSDHWEIYVTRVRDGRPSLARAVEIAAEEFGELIDLEPPDGAVLSAPSVVDWGGRRLVAAVVESAERSIALLESHGDSLTWSNGELEASTVLRARGGLHAFDADEVGGPALYVDRAGILRLYYAGRRGTRWSIGLRASGDGVVWPYSSEVAVLSPSGQGHDALSVRDPSVVTDGSVLQLFHTASDGARASVSRAAGGTRW